MNPKVIDLSHWNPTPDWVTLRKNGTLGVIHKATEGTSYVDDMLFERAGDAIKAGLKWATYHFLKPGDIWEQMQHYEDTVKPQLGERVVLDHEDEGVSLDELKSAVDYWVQIRPDCQVTVYSGHLIKQQLGDTRDDYLRHNTSLWIAQYGPEVEWPTNTWDTWSLWQYTDAAPVAGVEQPCDGNRWNGSDEALLAWFGPAAPEPGRETIDVAITTTAGVTVSVTLNGELIVGAAHA